MRVDAARALGLARRHAQQPAVVEQLPLRLQRVEADFLDARAGRARRIAARRSSEHPLPQREHEQRVAAASRSSSITPTPFFIAASSCRIGGGFTMSKNRNSSERERDAQRQSAPDEEEHQQERRDLVDDDAAVVGHAQAAAGHLRRPRAGGEQDHDGRDECGVARIRAQQQRDAESPPACRTFRARPAPGPAPKPSAMKCAGWRNRKRERRAIGHGSAEMIERTRQRRQRARRARRARRVPRPRSRCRCASAADASVARDAPRARPARDGGAVKHSS